MCARQAVAKHYTTPESPLTEDVSTLDKWLDMCTALDIDTLRDKTVFIVYKYAPT